jgi:hypothetical protein
MSNNIKGPLYDFYSKKSEPLFLEAKTDPDLIYIQGEFTNWLPVKMDDLVDYNIRVSKEEIPNFAEQCIKEGLIPKNRLGGFSEDE